MAASRAEALKNRIKTGAGCVAAAIALTLARTPTSTAAALPTAQVEISSIATTAEISSIPSIPSSSSSHAILVAKTSLQDLTQSTSTDNANTPDSSANGRHVHEDARGRHHLAHRMPIHHIRHRSPWSRERRYSDHGALGNRAVRSRLRITPLLRRLLRHPEAVGAPKEILRAAPPSRNQLRHIRVRRWRWVRLRHRSSSTRSRVLPHRHGAHTR